MKNLAVAACMSISALSATAGNPYGLVLENQFEQRFSAEVEPHWKQGKVGEMTGVDGIRLSYIRFLHPGEKGAIVVANGRTESYIKYKELAYDLDRQGYSVYILDHRGQGFSGRLLPDPQKGHVVHFEDYVQDFARFVQDVVQPASHPRLFLLSHSMGGAIATRYLQQYPGVFHAAVLASPMHAFHIPLSEGLGCALLESTLVSHSEAYVGFIDRPYKPKDFGHNPYTHSAPRYQQFLSAYQNPAVQLGGPTWRWASEACAVSQTMLNDVQKITTPLLVLQAGADTIVSLQAQNRFCDKLAETGGQGCHASQRQPLKIDGARHELFIESDTYRVPAINAMLDFFAAQKP